MLIIAHRLSTVKNCDKIIVLENGEIAEQGTHNELIANQGRYYRLWEMQQGNFIVDSKAEISPESAVEDFADDEGTLSYT